MTGPSSASFDAPAGQPLMSARSRIGWAIFAIALAIVGVVVSMLPRGGRFPSIARVERDLQLAPMPAEPSDLFGRELNEVVFRVDPKDPATAAFSLYVDDLNVVRGFKALTVHTLATTRPTAEARCEEAVQRFIRMYLGDLMLPPFEPVARIDANALPSKQMRNHRVTLRGFNVWVQIYGAYGGPNTPREDLAAINRFYAITERGWEMPPEGAGL